MHARPKQSPTARKWLWAAVVFLSIFLVYTTIFSTGTLLIPTIGQEQWLLHRPLTGADCTLRIWASAGDGPFSIFFTLVLSAVCLRLGYRRRVPFYLLILLLFSVGIEFVGKQFFPQPLPQRVDVGLNALDCPQIDGQPIATKALMLLGMWWAAPPPTQQALLEAQRGAAPLFDPHTETLVPTENSYPSGHAIRWSFLGLIACWLAWRHMRHGHLRALRFPVMVVALILALGGGFAQFYVGAHLSTDVIAGYFAGFGFASWAIALLLRNQKMKEIGRANPAPDE